jgi:16S rRNA processing protein RimM
MIVMGRVLAPYGVSGWIKVRTFSASPSALCAYRRWWLALGDGAWREFALVESRPHADTLLAHLEGLSRREDAAAWRGAAIALPRTALPELERGEVYLADLIGLDVVNRDGESLGCCAGLLDSPAHPVLRIDAGGGAERLIPLVPAYVDAIDLEARRIIVDWRTDDR